MLRSSPPLLLFKWAKQQAPSGLRLHKPRTPICQYGPKFYRSSNILRVFFIELISVLAFFVRVHKTISKSGYERRQICLTVHMSCGIIRLRTEGFAWKLALVTFKKFCQMIPILTKWITENSCAHLCTVTTVLASNITTVTVVGNFTFNFLVTKLCLVTNIISV